MFGTGTKLVYESPLSYWDDHSFDEFKIKNQLQKTEQNIKFNFDHEDGRNPLLTEDND